jgi:transposase
MRNEQISLSGMTTSSTDLRPKLLHACERRLGSQRALAALFGVSLSFVEKLLRRYRMTGDIAPNPPAGGQKPRRDAATAALVRRLVHDHAEVT